MIFKLLAFTAAMVMAPLGAYFGSLNMLFKGKLLECIGEPSELMFVPGNSTWAGATAALTANAVLISYVIVAMKEDQSERLEEEQKAKKSQ